MEPCQGPLGSPRSSSSGAKIKEKVLALLTQATVHIHATTRFCAPDCQRARGRFCLNGLLSFSLGFQLSNKTNCSPFGALLLCQIQAQPDRYPYRAQSSLPGSHVPFWRQDCDLLTQT